MQMQRMWTEKMNFAALTVLFFGYIAGKCWATRKGTPRFSSAESVSSIDRQPWLQMSYSRAELYIKLVMIKWNQSAGGNVHVLCLFGVSSKSKHYYSHIYVTLADWCRARVDAGFNLSIISRIPAKGGGGWLLYPLNVQVPLCHTITKHSSFVSSTIVHVCTCHSTFAFYCFSYTTAVVPAAVSASE